MPKKNMAGWISLFLYLTFFQFYVFQAVKEVSYQNFKIFYLVSSFLIIGNFFYQIFSRGFDSSSSFFSYSLGLFLSLFCFQLVVISILIVEDFFRLISFISSSLNKSENIIPNRRKFVSQIALISGAIPFVGLIFGMIYGKYNYRVFKYEMDFDDLPKSFDGFKITHISDIHSGSLDNIEKVKYGIDLINQQKSDVILFTGDLVNNKSNELEKWKDIFKLMEAPLGKFSILGNHDYGDYYDWKSKDEKINDFKKFMDYQENMGFKLLMNESIYLEKNEEKIAILGSENWGRGFKKEGDLDKMISKINKDDFKILMTHDPSHWEEKVLNHKSRFQLTLSGHTHGMQFGIEIPGLIKWSPVKWRYKQWAGIYKKDKKILNVNRGFGYLAYPGRLGIYPEISVITLRRRS
ncbi:MAG: metallophosphoesterase [Bacteroidota bacterium]|nr:metallophosphoesterase [Bacteroidota bacterium]